MVENTLRKPEGKLVKPLNGIGGNLSVVRRHGSF
jgi:hypothetical protein